MGWFEDYLEEKEKMKVELRKVTACFVGHCIAEIPWILDADDPRYIGLKRAIQYILEIKISQGYERFLCSMERGFDTLVAETVLEMKEKYPKIQLIGILMCNNQGDKWEKQDKARLQNLKSKLDDYEGIYYNYFGVESFLGRYEEMAKRSSLMITLYHGKYEFGLVPQAINIAKKQGIEVYII